MKTFSFRNGDKIPALGLGTWLSKKDELYNAILNAISVGYRHFDCAYIYQNEAEIGRAFNEVFSSGILKREELFITSKLWNSFHAPEDVELGIKKSLENLQLDYLDLFLMHWPIAFKKNSDIANSAADLLSLTDAPLSDTWIAMSELKNKGLTKHIGVSNFNISKINALIKDSGIQPEMNQVELHPYLQQDELLDFCKMNNILLTAYSPLGGRHYAGTEKGVENEAIIIEIAKRHNCKPTQVVLAWGLQRDSIVIPKSTNKERIENNFAANNIMLNEEEMLKIKSLNRNLRISSAKFAIFPDGPYSSESIWVE